MANINFIDMKTGEIQVNLKVSESEYSILKQARENILLLPGDSETLEETLTTGKLGNGNRIMLPNKILGRHGIEKLRKKIPAGIFDINGDKFMLIKLEESKLGVPVFKGDDDG